PTTAIRPFWAWFLVIQDSEIAGPLLLALAASALAVSGASAQASKAKGFSTEIVVSQCREFAESKVSPEGVLLKEDFDNGFCYGLFTMTLKTVMTANRDTGKRLLGVCAPEG